MQNFIKCAYPSKILQFLYMIDMLTFSILKAIMHAFQEITQIKTMQAEIVKFC